MADESKLRVGVDVGGTKIALGLVNPANELISDTPRFEVAPYKSGDALVEKLVEEIRQLIADSGYSMEDLAGIGIGSPGPLDLDTGTILNTPNMPQVRDYPLRDSVAKAAGLNTELNNDANCFVLGEALAGEAKAGEIVIGVTLGTGFGFGIVFDGKIYTGATGTAAEIAHCPYLDGYLEEGYISGRGLSMMYDRRTGEDVEGLEISQRAQDGEDAALAAFAEFGEHLGRAFAWFVNILDPDFIVVGGSIAKNWDFFQKSMHKMMYEYINPNPRDHMQIVPSKLGERAAIFGSAGLIRI